MSHVPSRAPGALEPVRGEFGLVFDALHELRGLCVRTEGLVRVWVFGSRAREDWRPRSDIDLAVDAPAWSTSRFLDFQYAVRQLPIVYRVDLVHWQQASQELRAEIERDKKLLWELPVTSS